jgi:hypothetical protein
MEDYRPFFTYWVTTVHVLVMALSILCYGLGPLGIDLNQRSGLVCTKCLRVMAVVLNFLVIGDGAQFVPAASGLSRAC